MSEKKPAGPSHEEMMTQSNQRMSELLDLALSQSSVVVLAIEPARGGVYTVKEKFGPGAREIEVGLIESQAGVAGVREAFAQAASRAESVAVSGLGGASGSGAPSAEAMEAMAEGVRALSAAGGRAVVVAHKDLSGLDFGKAHFVGAMLQSPGPDISSALLSRRAAASSAQPSAKPGPVGV